MFEASSLGMELGEPVERGALIAGIFGELEGAYERLQRGDLIVILQQWRHISATLGQPIRVRQRDKVIEGIAIDVTDEGGLEVRLEDGSLMIIHSGNVEHLRLAAEVGSGGQ